MIEQQADAHVKAYRDDLYARARAEGIEDPEAYAANLRAAVSEALNRPGRKGIPVEKLFELDRILKEHSRRQLN